MKLRSTLFTCACLLLMGSLASAAPANEALTTPLSAGTSPGCPAADLPFLSPAPTEKAATPCGSCSSTSCLGKNVWEVCAYISGKVYTCYNFGTCSDGATPRCSCYRIEP